MLVTSKPLLEELKSMGDAGWIAWFKEEIGTGTWRIFFQREVE